MSTAHKRFEDSLHQLIQKAKEHTDTVWEGTMTEYLGLLHENCGVAQTASIPCAAARRAVPLAHN